jgi:hypothetical protein
MAHKKPKRSRKGPKEVKGVQTIQEAQGSSATSRILEWSSKVPLLRRSKRERRLPDRYGFATLSSTPPMASKRNPKRKRTEEAPQAPQLARIAEIREQDQGQSPSISSKSPSNKASDITDVDQLEKYDPPIYFNNSWEFEGAVLDGDDEAISLQLRNLVKITQIKRTATHSGVIPLALKVDFSPYTCSQHSIYSA